MSWLQHIVTFSVWISPARLFQWHGKGATAQAGRESRCIIRLWPHWHVCKRSARPERDEHSPAMSSANICQFQTSRVAKSDTVKSCKIWQPWTRTPGAAWRQGSISCNNMPMLLFVLFVLQDLPSCNCNGHGYYRGACDCMPADSGVCISLETLTQSLPRSPAFLFSFFSFFSFLLLLMILMQDNAGETTCKYTSIYIHYTHRCPMYVFVCVHVSVHMYTHTHIYIYIYMCVCV